MRNFKEEQAFKNEVKVSQITFNPREFGAVRIHLIPPKITDPCNIPESLIIINGNYILPIRKGHSLLLYNFMNAMKEFDGIEVSECTLSKIIKDCVAKTHKVYWRTSKKELLNDLEILIDAFTKIARGERVDIKSTGIQSIGEYAPYMKAPHRMDLMVSSMTDTKGNWNCNNKCLHCYAANQFHSGDMELPTKSWIDIIDKCIDAGIVQLTFTGGEPTMRKDLPELIKHSKFAISRVNTNGILLSKDYCNRLKDAELDSIQITFYSSNEEIHNALVRNENGYKKTINGIKNAIDAGLNVSINTPLCTINKDYTSTLKLLNELGITYVTCSSLITTGNAEKEESENTQLTSEELKNILEEAVLYCGETGMELSFTSPGWLDEDILRNLKLKVPSCGACLSNMAITPAGYVVPCQSWLDDINYGNILVDDWDDIWERSASLRVKTAKQDGSCPLKKNKDRRKN